MSRSTSKARAVVATPFEAAVTRTRPLVHLRDLDIAPENMRFGEPLDDEIPLLAETLFAAGQLQPLTVRPGRKGEAPHMALDGRRRLLALRVLLEQGRIDDAFLVDVFVETDPARQAAAVLLTNTAVPVHVADVIAAIGRMLKGRLAVPTIARALGYAELDVKRLAVLSALPSAALVALKAGKISLKQARLLARLPDKAEQEALAEEALDGYGFQDWRIIERLDDTRVTTRDRRWALVEPEAYAKAGGRTENDLFGEMPAVLLDPDILSDVWLIRARRIAAVFEAQDIAVHVTAGPEPDLADDLEPIGYVHGGGLSAEALARYRGQREIHSERVETVRNSLAAGETADRVDLAIVDMIQAKIAADRTGCGARAVTTMVMWPAGGVGVEVRCYTPEEPKAKAEGDATDDDDAAVSRNPPAPVFVEPQVEAVDLDTEGVNHALHALRTEVATRGLIRALADDPGAALTALIARLFTVLVLRTRIARSDSALAILATGFGPVGGRAIDSLDGEIRHRLEVRRAEFEASGETVIAWVHAQAHGEKMSLLAELTAVSLDVREERTTLIRRGARAEATELAVLCDADITLHWTPDAPFLQPHSKGLLNGMLTAMGSEDPRTAALKKIELVDWVAEQAAERRWAPPFLSWRAAPEDVLDPNGADARASSDEDGEDGAGAFAVTPAGEAALEQTAA